MYGGMRADIVRVSIITVCLNAEKTIRRTIESVDNKMSNPSSDPWYESYKDFNNFGQPQDN